MSQEPETKKLGPGDPVDPGTMKKLAEIQTARVTFAEQLMDLEQEKVRILVGARQLDAERARTFDKILIDRGIPTGTPVEVDGQTGTIRVLRDIAQPSQEAPVAPS